MASKKGIGRVLSGFAEDMLEDQRQKREFRRRIESALLEKGLSDKTLEPVFGAGQSDFAIEGVPFKRVSEDERTRREIDRLKKLQTAIGSGAGAGDLELAFGASGPYLKSRDESIENKLKRQVSDEAALGQEINQLAQIGTPEAQQRIADLQQQYGSAISGQQRALSSVQALQKAGLLRAGQSGLGTADFTKEDVLDLKGSEITGGLEEVPTELPDPSTLPEGTRADGEGPDAGKVFIVKNQRWIRIQ